MSTLQGSYPLLLRGGFVQLPGQLGFGKLLTLQNGLAEVSIFYSAAHIETELFSESGLSRAYLSPETRTFVREDDRWRVGRVKDYLLRNDGLVEYQIQFPNGKMRDVVESELFVRPWTASEDPATTLAEAAVESQYLHDRRRRASERLIAISAATEGMSALLSSSIDLVPHQVAAIRRVLSDPVQRYLLADEVGMGKTIEAGVIIRQCLIDGPSRNVTVIVPRGLVIQWRTELNERFRAQDFPKLHVVSYEEIDECGSPELLVIDEAHNVIDREDIRHFAHTTPRLLLISATPLLDDEPRFLALLNLLDPAVYRVEDIESFRRKVRERQSIGRLLIGLQPDAPPIVLKQRLNEVIERLRSDKTAAELAGTVSAALNDDDTLTAEEACRALRFYIADAYRIHQRVIRSRRSDTVEFQPRAGRDPVRVEIEDDLRFSDLAAVLEDWREQSISHRPDATREECLAIAQRFVRIIAAAGQSIEAAAEVAVDISAQDPEGFNGLAEAISAIRAQPTDGSKVDLIVASLDLMRRAAIAEGFAEPKMVAFFSSARDAERVYQRYKPVQAALIKDGDTSALERFKSDPKTWILLADATAEEGLNLQFAHGIVHTDLPFSVARIEQRIGRLDRFGRPPIGMRQRVVLPLEDEGSFWDAWFGVLSEGFEVFRRSVSDIQFLLSSLEDELTLAIYRRGSAGLADAIPYIRERLAEERRRQDEQYALDRVALAEEPVESLVQNMKRIEIDHELIGREIEDWLIDVMHLKKQPMSYPRCDPFFLRWTSSTLVPRIPWHDQFGADLDHRPLTWSRETSNRYAGVSLLRQGTPLIDGSEKYMRYDDRGAAFITWRVIPGLEETLEGLQAFRLCFVIDSDTPEGELIGTGADEATIKRRASAFLPPWTRTLYVDLDNNRIRDTHVTTLLELPYVSGRTDAQHYDVNLGSRMSIFHAFIDADTFADICRLVRNNSETAIRGDVEFKSRHESAMRIALREIQRYRRRAERRSIIDPAAKGALDNDLHVDQLVLNAVRHPRVRLDAMGFMILSSQPPPTPSEE